MDSTKFDRARMATILKSTAFDADVAEISKENPPAEDNIPVEEFSQVKDAMPTEEGPSIEHDLLIEELDTLLEEMQCLGYEGAQGVEHQLCVVCDKILSILPAIMILDTLPWCIHVNPHMGLWCSAGLGKVSLRQRQGRSQTFNFVKLSKRSNKKHSK